MATNYGKGKNDLDYDLANKHFQPGEGPSTGLLHDCEILANPCLKL